MLASDDDPISGAEAAAQQWAEYHRILDEDEVEQVRQEARRQVEAIHRRLVVAAMELDDPTEHYRLMGEVYQHIDALDSTVRGFVLVSMLWPDARAEADGLQAKAREHIEAGFGKPKGYRGWHRWKRGT